MTEAAKMQQMKLKQHQHEYDPEYSDEPVADVARLMRHEAHVAVNKVHLQLDVVHLLQNHVKEHLPLGTGDQWVAGRGVTARVRGCAGCLAALLGSPRRSR